MEQQRQGASEISQDAAPRGVAKPLPKVHQTPDDIIHMMEKDQTQDVDELVPLPFPYEDWKDTPIATLSDEQRERFEAGPDGVSALQIPKPGHRGGEGREGRAVPGRPGQAPGQGEQLDLPPALDAVAGELRQVPDLQRLLRDLHRLRPGRDVPPHLPGRDPAQDHRPPHQARGRHPAEAAGTRHRGQLGSAGEPGRAVVPLHAVPALRPGLPHRGGQRPHQP